VSWRRFSFSLIRGRFGSLSRIGFRQRVAGCHPVRVFDLTRQIRLPELTHFRFDVFNTLNHPNLNLPNRIFNPSPTSPFGSISSAQDPRELQFAMKLMF